MKSVIRNIKMAPDLMPKVRDGSKLLTIRKGWREGMEPGPLFIENANDDTDKICIVEVHTISYTFAKDIPVDLIVADGFKDLNDMVNGMGKYYPGFTRDHACTVIQWRPREQ